MVASVKVIDAEIIEDEPRPQSVIDATVQTARVVASGLEQIGFGSAATKARAAAEVAESAQDAYHAMRPGVRALGNLWQKLQDTGIVKFVERVPLRRVP